MSRAVPRLRIVTGKGGVGKSVVATSLALAEALAGRRTLLAEVRGRDRAAMLLDAPSVGDEMREVRERLFVVDMDPQAAMREYALIVLRFESVYKAVFENRMVQRFLRLIPSLPELVMLGKVWYHEQQEENGRPRFDVVVLDAPATGHAIAMLRAPDVVHRVVPPGPLRDITQNLKSLLTDRERTLLHVVTTPEEMPVTEAMELEQAAAELLDIRLGTTFINQRLEPLPEGALELLEQQARAHEPSRDEADLLLTLRLREDRRRNGEEQLRRLPAYMHEDAVSLPRLVSDRFGITEIERLAARMSPVIGAAEPPAAQEASS